MNDTDRNRTITEEHIKEKISKGYIDALVAYAGFNTYNQTNDYGFDGGFEEVKIRGGRYVSSGHKIDYQLKASSNVEIKNGFVIYDLEVKNYNDLVDTDIGTPRILILYRLPKNKEGFISVNIEKTEYQHCAFWISLKGKEISKNKTTQRIQIPIENIVTKEALQKIMEKVRKGEELND